MGLIDKIRNAKEGPSLFEDISPARMFALKIQAAISLAIYSERIRRQMTQAEFSEECGVTQAQVSKWESGEYNFSVQKWAELSYLLELPFDPTVLQKTASADKIIQFSKYATSNNYYVTGSPTGNYNASQQIASV